ncbi:MAG: alpha-amylase family glycosyl hydrolase [Chloroflexi bacterium]|nr:alpha-amylase family glycosyl hydrolase [Chloroflexota bacterium]MCY4246062.1 alpha-amylase family glycosyl hydrolase [Chloroflexota bacterium]
MNSNSRAIVGALVGCLLSLAVLPAQSQAPQPTYWWNDRVFYEVFIRSFQDSDGDGIGDIQGLISRLDYLNDGDPSAGEDLGITGLWLMPPTEAHSYHGYDVTDYYAVERDYGTLADMRQLVAAARERGIAVIVDMVLNHTSSRHPWFLGARSGDPAWRDWYIWADEDPGYHGPWGDVAWHRAGGDYYYGVFWDGMPDLNFHNPAVTQEMQHVASFWLRDIGVDGFRLDAIKHLIEAGERQENLPESRQWLSGYEAHLEAVKPGSFTVGEIFGGPSFVVARYVNERAIDIGFDFKLAGEMIEAASRGSNRDIIRAHRAALRDYPFNQFATFLTNHDQNRLANSLRQDIGRNKAAASLLLTGPGVPFLYYGEEIGMVGTKPDERIRSPMQWDDSPLAGFSNAARAWQPLQAAGHIASVNVARQTADAESLLSHYRDLVHLRNRHTALRRGDWTHVESSARGIYAFLRSHAQERLLVIINLDDEASEGFTLSLAESKRDLSAPTLVFGRGELRAPRLNAAGGFADYAPVPSLPAHSTIVLVF